MAINPIQLFQTPTDLLSSILQGGSNALTGIMDRAISIGKQNVDNQIRQEQDLFGLRKQETALSQRRAENLQDLISKTQDRAIGVDQFNQKFAANRSDEAFQQNRLNANDLFSQNDSDRRFGLAEDTFAANKANSIADNTRLDNAAQQKAAAEHATQQRVSALYGEAPETLSSAVNVTGMFGGTAPNPKLKAARDVLSDPNASAFDKNQALKIVSPTTAAGGLTPYQKESLDRAKRTEDRLIKGDERREAKDDAVQQEKEIGKIVLDSKTFVPPTTTARKRGFVNEKGEIDNAKISDPDLRNDIADYTDQKALNYELGKALNYDNAAAYVALVPGLSKPQQEKRRKLWEYAWKNQTPDTSLAPTGPVSAAPASSLSDLINSLKK